MTQWKRPAAVWGGAFAATLAVVYMAGPVWAALAVLCVAGAFPVLKLAKKQKRGAWAVVFSAAVAALCIWGVHTLYGNSVLAAHSGREAVVLGYVTETAQYGQSTLVTAKLTQVQGGAAGFEVTFFTKEELTVGDGFSAQMRFRQGQSPYANHLSMQADAVTLLARDSGARPLLAWAAGARRYLAGALRDWLPGAEGAVAAAVITGDKSSIPVSLNLIFNSAGISHILVVSGLHITLIISLLMGAAQKLRAGRVVQLVLLVGMIAGCVLLYGFHPSVLRACVMCFMLYAGGVLLRSTDSVTSMAVAAVVLLAVQPTAILEASFLLSFGCCFALTVVFPAVQHAIHRRISGKGFWAGLLRTLLSTLAMTATINVVIFPVMMMFGMRVSVVSPFANLLVVPLVPVLLVASFLACIPIEFITGLSALVAGLVAKAIIAVATFFSGLPFATVNPNVPFVRLFVIYCIAVLALCLAKKGGRVRKGVAILCVLLVLAGGTLSRRLFTMDKPYVVLYRDSAVIVQDGDSVFLSIGDIDLRGVDYLADFCAGQFRDKTIYVIMTQDAGPEVERYVAETISPIVHTRYLSYMPGHYYYDSDKTLYLNIGRIYVLSYPDGSLSVQWGDALLSVGGENSRMTGNYARLYSRDGWSYYLVGDETRGRTYAANKTTYLYIDAEGGVKAVVE